MISFRKMQGCGNDFIVLDARKGALPALDYVKLADRRFGIGCDQIVIFENTPKADVFMRIFNADGSEANACGNASRCVGWLMHGEGKEVVVIDTLGGLLQAYVHDGLVTVDMGKPRLAWDEIPLAREMDTLHLPLKNGLLADPVGVSMGNPHAVFFVDDVDAVPLAQLGAALEHNMLFPDRANIGVAQVLGGDRIKLRVWERGGGLPLSCGTGACAALVAAHRRGLSGRRAAVFQPGGLLAIEWNEASDHVLMAGRVAVVFEGKFNELLYQ